MPIPRNAPLALAVTATLSAAGCAAPSAELPLTPFAQGDLALVREICREEALAGSPRLAPLFRNGEAQAQLYLGRLDEARGLFESTAPWMGHWRPPVDPDPAWSAGLSSAGVDPWGGDPHEQGMHGLYLGLLYLLADMPDNARAVIQGALAADRVAGDGPESSDNALLHWFAGRMALLMGLRDSAAGDFDRARSARSAAVAAGAEGVGEPRMLSAPGQGNLLCVVESGFAPAVATRGERVVYLPRDLSVVDVQVFLDGQLAPEPALLCDVGFQAVTRGGEPVAIATPVEERRVRGAAVWLADQLRGPDQARHWSTLPAAVWVLPLQVEPGPHRVVVRFLDRQGKELPGLTQSHQVTVPKTGEAWFLFRDLP